ncbi:hypothetical protein [Streptomyces anulatus]|uniref:hypothetical protein n=1 Tax=Streptomyces anulatus TaxID=1892 RepID=UPI003416A7F4
MSESYERQPQSHADVTAEEQGVIMRAELAANGWDVEPPQFSAQVEDPEGEQTA